MISPTPLTPPTSTISHDISRLSSFSNHILSLHCRWSHPRSSWSTITDPHNQETFFSTSVSSLLWQWCVSVQVATYRENKWPVWAAHHSRQKNAQAGNKSSQPAASLMTGEEREGGRGRWAEGRNGKCRVINMRWMQLTRIWIEKRLHSSELTRIKGRETFMQKLFQSCSHEGSLLEAQHQ